jgi:two-component system, NarL family, sensor histidine kinase DevS
MAATENPSGPTNPSSEFLTNASALGLGFAWVIVDLAPDAILVSDDDGRIMLANRHLETLFGYDRDALVGTQVEALLPTHLRADHETHRANYVAAPALRPMGAGLDLFGRHANGSEFPIEVSLSPAATDVGIATVVIIRDVTEQRILERAARIASARENDDRIASDLHDHVINHLFGCGLTLASVIGRNQLDDHIVAQLYDVVDELDTAVKQIRDTVFARLEQ